MSDSSAAPRTVTRQSLLSTRFFKQEYWTKLPFPPPGDLPDPGAESMAPATSPALQVDSSPLSHQRSLILNIRSMHNTVYWTFLNLMKLSLSPQTWKSNIEYLIYFSSAPKTIPLRGFLSQLLVTLSLFSQTGNHEAILSIFFLSNLISNLVANSVGLTFTVISRI